MVICLEQGADLHMAQLMPLPLTVSCFCKIQIGFTFLVPAYPGSPGQRDIKRVYVTIRVVNFVKLHCILKDLFIKEKRFLISASWCSILQCNTCRSFVL